MIHSYIVLCCGDRAIHIELEAEWKYLSVISTACVVLLPLKYRLKLIISHFVRNF